MISESLQGKGHIVEGEFVDIWKALFGGKKKRGEKEKGSSAPKSKITEYDDEDDWIMTMILMAIKHAFPDLDDNETIRMAYTWAKRVGTPNAKHMWQRQLVRMSRIGIRAEASKIRRELYKLL